MKQGRAANPSVRPGPPIAVGSVPARALQFAMPSLTRRSSIDCNDATALHRKALLNIARMGKFSTDRTVSEYARDIWKIRPAVVGNFAHAALLGE